MNIADIGEIKEKDTLLFREALGTMKNEEEGLSYELTTTIPDRAPMVKSLKTGKTFILSWDALVRIAIERGIDQ